MTERKALFRRVYDSMIEGRNLQAQRMITEYLRTHPILAQHRN